jgi:hypothetical protein
MDKHIPRSLTLPVLLLALAAAAVPPAAAQSGSSSQGRYRSQGNYRPQGHYLAPRPPIKFQNPWSPMTYRQNKYYQVVPQSQAAPFTSNLSRSNLPNYGGIGFNVVVPVPVLPVAGVYEPYTYEQEPPPPPPPAPAPQIYVVQTPPPAAAPPPYEPPPPPPPAPPVSNEPGELALDVQPADVRIFLNDRLMGTGESLEAKGEPLRLRAGVYVLEAEHPDFGSQRLVFGVTAEQTVRVVVDLTADQPRRRARVVRDKDADFLLN